MKNLPDETTSLWPAEVLEKEFAALHDASIDFSAPPRQSGQSEHDYLCELEQQREKAVRAAVHRLSEENSRSALCLSGGGVRSATFCLGVLQALAETRRLERFHYLSSVSGGGYIASWLTGWIARENGDIGKVLDQVAPRRLNPTQRPASAEPSAVRRLRAYSNYLSPVQGFSMDLITLIATFVRNLALHWLVLLPLLAAMVMVPYMTLALFHLTVPKTYGSWFWLLQSIAAISGGFGLSQILRNLPSHSTNKSDKSDFVGYCLLPILAGAYLQSCVLQMPPCAPDWMTPTWQLLCIYVGVGAVLSALCKHFIKNTTKINPLTVLQRLLPVATTGALAGLLMFAIMKTASITRFDVNHPDAFVSLAMYVILRVPAILGILWICITFYVGISRRYTPEEDREWWARASAWLFWIAAGWITFSSIVLLGPWLLIKSPFTLYIGSSAGALGILTGLYGFWSKQGARIERRVKSVVGLLGDRLLETAGALFIIALFIMLSIAVIATAAALGKPGASIWTAVGYGKATLGIDLAGIAGSLLALIAVSALCSRFIGTNTFSLHNMYGNRLVRAYLGASNERRDPDPFADFDPKDNLSMEQVRVAAQNQASATKQRLFPVINIALNLVKPSKSRLDWQQRKAAPFTVTPLHAGSPCTNYRPSHNYSAKHGITLGRAMTISGAAATSNMGYHTSSLVAFVMTFFNIRLGWWLPNPLRGNSKSWERSEPENGVITLVKESIANTTDDSNYIYLSDGGHFDNLGLYEMVRRRSRHIVVVDASCDPGYSFEDLENAVRKIRVDLGISIVFPDGLPTPARAREAAHKHRHSTVGIVRYDDVDGSVINGTIIYIKPLLSGDEPLDVTRYAALAKNKQINPFPHHSTADQFFDEIQFENYRALGYHSVMQEPLLNCSLPDSASGPGGDWAAKAADAAAAAAAAAANYPPAAPQQQEDGAGDSAETDNAGSLIPAALWPVLAAGTMALTVTGVVTLSNPEVTLKQPVDIRLKADSIINPSWPPAVQELPPYFYPSPAPALPDDLVLRLAELLTVTERLQQAIADNTSTGTASFLSMQRLLDKELALIRTRPGNDNQLLINSINQLSAVLNQQPLRPGEKINLTVISDELENIRGELQKINTSVNKLAPRNHVRGTEGGR